MHSTIISLPLLAACASGCGGTEEAATVLLPVTTAGAPMPPAMTDLGYRVQVERMRVAVTAIQFTIEGEMHEAAPPSIIAPHPGHSAGGEVTGELPGDHILQWNGQVQPALGDGTLIVGDYRGANFAFRGADARDGLAAGDPLAGHAFHLTGTIAKDAASVPFDAVLDVEPDTRVVGAVFEDTITEASTETLAIAFLPTDPSEQDTAFDGVDFFTLPTTPAGTIEIRPGSAAHNILRRALQTHDHYSVLPQ
jgi:hypothetical protein